MKVLLDHPWPGNVRQLANAIEYAVAVSKLETLLPEDLSEEIRHPHLLDGATRLLSEVADGHHSPEHAHSNDDPECRRLREALEANHWRRDEAAKALGLSRTTLWRKMREFKLA
jgi:transcriptional regulator of acetoin/glycerol metabolism